MRDIAKILQKTISPFEEYCSGCTMDSSGYYVTTPLIATGVAPIECSHSGSDLLDRIIAFDRAEGAEANITQTNMVTVSSFNGLNGAILGYDFLKNDLRRHQLLDEETYPNVYDAEPLFQATKSLYGTVKEKHFPIAPGQHILSAYKTYYKYGPCMIYGILGIAIPKDRTKNADLYMEDHGTIVATHNKAANLEQHTMVVENLVRSISRISENLNVEYEKIIVGFRCKNVPAGQVGCVITAAPYIHLAQNAIPDGNPQLLEQLSLKEWQTKIESKLMKNS